MTIERLESIIALTRGPRGIETVTGIPRRMIQRWQRGVRAIPPDHAATLEEARKKLLRGMLERKVAA